MASGNNRVISIRWPEDLHRQIVEYAEKHDVSFNAAVKQLLRLGFEEYEFEQRAIAKAKLERQKSIDSSDPEDSE